MISTIKITQLRRLAEFKSGPKIHALVLSRGRTSVADVAK